jgi:hypothetical protein
MQNNLSKAHTTTAIVAIALAAVLSVYSITPALAARPHFVGTPTCEATPGPGSESRTLTCSGKIAGLGNVSEVSAFLQASVQTGCTNPGGGGTAPHNPPGLQRVQSTPVTLEVTNGQTVFSLSITASADCPPSQTGFVGTFSNVAVVVDSTTLRISGTF